MYLKKYLPNIRLNKFRLIDAKGAGQRFHFLKIYVVP